MTAEAVWDSDTLALLRSECNSIESEQGSGSKGDAVLYNTWLLRNVNIFFFKFSGKGNRA